MIWSRLYSIAIWEQLYFFSSSINKCIIAVLQFKLYTVLLVLMAELSDFVLYMCTETN